MSVLALFRKLVALATKFVMQRRAWKELGKRRHHGDAQYTEFPKSWSTRAEGGLQGMDYTFRSRVNRRDLGERTQFARAQIPIDLKVPPGKYQLHQREEASMQRISRRRVMVVSNPDPADDSEGELDMKIRDARAHSNDWSIDDPC